jgi:tRNA modification GTPase
VTATTVDDTIAAPATPPGHGGVAVIRISGPVAATIGEALAPPLPAARMAALRTFRAADGAALDQGLVLWFPAPGSYTGEDTVELHGHGGPAVVDAVLARALALGARHARPGELSERAFLNGRLDLAQAEAVADLIESADAAGARAAMRSLEGAFSARVSGLVDGLTEVRAWLEAAFDFPEDDIDLVSEGDLAGGRARGGDLAPERGQAPSQVEGATVVLAGATNTGKSSLLNRLTGSDSAIVTAIEGTTRDLLDESVQFEGMPVTLVDTAGLRVSEDPVEQEGVRRARGAVDRADRVLLVADAREAGPPETIEAPAGAAVDVIYNKIDLTGAVPGVSTTPDGRTAIAVSAATGAGLDELAAHLRRVLGADPGAGAAFSARRRHLEALDRADEALATAESAVAAEAGAELAAEHLRAAQQALGEITGQVTTEDLLGEIFSRFCIGK